MYGIENLKLVVKFLIDLGKQVAEASKDGFKWTDSFGLLPHLIKIPGLLQKGDEVVAEFKDMSIEERNDLFAFIQQEFDIENDKVEALVEASLGLLLSGAVLIDKINAMKPPAVELPPPPIENGNGTNEHPPI